MKIRDDQRIQNPDNPAFLRSLIKHFKPSLSSKLQTRIIFSSEHSLLNIPYHLCDMFQYSTTDNLINLWQNTELQNFNVNIVDFKSSHWSKTKFYDPSNIINRPHIELGLSLAKISHHCDIKDPYFQYISTIRDSAIFVDFNDLDLYWRKYNSTNFIPNYLSSEKFSKISFSKWLTLIEPNEFYQRKYSYDELY